jgi:hypothetical protein
MKKIIVMLIFCTLALSAEKIEFFGNYHSDMRKEKAEDRKGFVGGCIYNGKFSDKKLVKVYTKEACPGLKGKEKAGGAISCEVTCHQCENGRRQEYLMYEGTCEVKN